MNKQIKDFLFLSLILTAVLVLPSLFPSTDPITRLGVSLICNLLFLLYIGNSVFRSGALERGKQVPYLKHILILLPTILFFLGAPIAWMLPGGTFISTYSGTSWLYLLNSLVIVLNEEFVFRLMLQNRLFFNSRLKRILVSAGIFALFDLVVFLQTLSILATLIQMATSFVLGVFLGAMMEYGHSIYPCIIFHFLYEFFDSTYMAFFAFESEIYAFLELVLSIVAICYIVIIYFVYFRKKEI